MSRLKRSFPGIVFALFVISIILYSIVKLSSTVKKKPSDKTVADTINKPEYSDLIEEDEDQTIDTSYFNPLNDSIPFSTPHPHSGKKSIIQLIISKTFKMVSDGFAKRSDSLQSDSTNK